MSRHERLEQLTAHYLDLFSLAMAIVRNSDDAKDAIQDAIAETLARIGHLHDPYAYCAKTLRNNCIDIIRRRKRMKQIGDLELLLSEPKRELADEAWRLKDQLPDPIRALIELHDIEGYSVTELALLTGHSVSKVKRLIAKGHEQLKNELIN